MHSLREHAFTLEHKFDLNGVKSDCDAVRLQACNYRGNKAGRSRVRGSHDDLPMNMDGRSFADALNYCHRRKGPY